MYLVKACSDINSTVQTHKIAVDGYRLENSYLAKSVIEPYLN